MRAAPRSGKQFLTRWIEERKRCVCQACPLVSTEQFRHELGFFFTLISRQPNADKISRGVDNFFVGQETPVHALFARSPDPRNAVTMRSRGNEHDGATAPSRLGQSGIKCAVVSDFGCRAEARAAQ